MLHSDEARGNALTRARSLERLVVHLDRADAGLRSVGSEDEMVADRDGSRPERPGDHAPDATERERAVDGQARRPVGRARRQSLAGTFDRGAQALDRLDVRDCGLHDLGRGERAVGEQLLHLGTCELGLDVVDQVPLAQRHDRALDSQELADRDVLARLRHHAVVACDDDQREVDPGRPGDHRPDEALVTRDVDDGELPARGEHERCVAELDRDAASVLLG